MTRREELQLRAVRIAKECIKLGMYPLANEIEQALIQVEREVWLRVADKIATEMDKENESTDDQIWEIRDWCKEQKEAL